MRRAASGSLVALVVLGVGCTPPPETLGTVERTVTAQPVLQEAYVPVTGIVTNRRPVPVVPPLSWLTITKITPEGANVDPGAPLLDYDRDELRRRLDDADNELLGGRADDARRRLEGEGTAQRRDVELQGLTSRAAVLQAQIQGRQRDEPGDRRIAALLREVAQRTRDHAAHRLSEVESLIAAGRLPVYDRAAAQADVAQAEAALAAAQRDERQWEEGRAALDRAGLELDLAEVRSRLEDGPRSLKARHEAWRRQDERWRRQAALWRQVPEQMRDQLAAVTQTAATTTPVAGQVLYRDPGLRPGARRPRTPLLFILEDHEVVVELLVPTELRDLVAMADDAGSRQGVVRLRFPSRPGAAVEGRIIAIGAAPVTKPGGRSGFPVTVRAPAGALPSVGSTVLADLIVPVAGAVRVPRWAVHQGADPRAPTAVLADGSSRKLTAFADDQDVVITMGLAPGDRVQALGVPPRAAASTRIAGLLEPEGAVTVRLRNNDWDVVEAVPDGALVSAGATLARLTRNSDRQDADRRRLEIEAGQQRLRLDRDIAEADADMKILDAQDRVGEARMGLRRALLDRRRVGLTALSDRLATAEADLAKRTAEAARAMAMASAAQDPRVAISLSRTAAADLVLAGRKAEAAMMAARLTAASVQIPDQFTAAESDLAVARAEAALGAARRALTLARLDAAAARDRAAATFRREEERLNRDADGMSDERVISPLAGRVAYRPGQPLEPGKALTSSDLLTLMPEPPAGGELHRRLALLVPTHLAATWHVGQEVPVTVPGAGVWPGRVTAVGTWYGRRPGDDVGDEQVTDLVVSVRLPATAADRVLPGMQGWIE